MNQTVFKRYEKKYLLSLEQYHALISRVIPRLRPDQYGKHSICNLYFDSRDFGLIRRSLEKPAYKEKIRLRSYGVPGPRDQVFLELKKKYDGVVYKRRVAMPLAEARQYLSVACATPGERLVSAVSGEGARGFLAGAMSADQLQLISAGGGTKASLAGGMVLAGAGETFRETGPGRSGQILKEIDYAIRFHQVRPAVYLAYERIAFSGKEDPELRVTFDMNIRARDYGLVLEQGTFGVPLLGRGEFLMEVKIPGAMPLWMSRALSELGIYPVSYSKYGTYYRDFLAGKALEEGGKACA